jgi:hypothetical protein
MPPGGEMADGQKYAHSLVKHKTGVLENSTVWCT